MDKFLSCDWGTSSFRLRLVEVPSLKVLAEEKSDQGIANSHTLWQQSGDKDPDKRLMFYLNLVGGYIQHIEKKIAGSLKGIPLVFSGMASSSIGMRSLPYGPLPFHTAGAGILSALFEENENFNHPILLISGIQSEEDVMRGEETQLVGVMKGLEDKEGEKVFIFPGTHSKHIVVKDQQVVGFKTYMTGEFFHLLTTKSILASSVEKNMTFDEKENLESFDQGVKEAVHSNLLNATFRVRTNELFDKMAPKENYHYLSGLLIGTELKELLQQDSAKIYLCCSSNLKSRYEAALIALGIGGVQVFSGPWIEEAVIRGQFQIYNQLQKR
ncbi:MAG: 2-dehydro-3-deoxygalactonokinase [Anditalea sp.]